MNKKQITLASLIIITLVIFLAFNLNNRVLKKANIELKPNDQDKTKEYTAPPKVIAIKVISHNQIELNNNIYQLKEIESVIREKISQDSRSPVLIRVSKNHNRELMTIFDIALGAGIKKEKITVARIQSER